MVSLVENPNVYTDLAGLQSISRVGRENTPEGLRQVAQQFESMFINMMLKSMRDSNSSLFEDNYMRSNEMEFHQENLDNQLSLHMASVGGFGLADSLYKQMLGRYENETTPVGAGLPAINPTPIPSRAGLAPTGADGAADSSRAGLAPAGGAPISSPEEFVKQLLPIAEDAAARLGVDPRVLLAQSALETGWGQSIPRSGNGHSSHNLFGVKADTSWTGEHVNVGTLEYRDGLVRQEKASFRSYQSYAESFSDYVEFLQSNPRYARALQHAGDPQAFATQLQHAGYATDPAYAQKIDRVINSPIMNDALAKARFVKETIQKSSLRHVTTPTIGEGVPAIYPAPASSRAGLAPTISQRLLN